MNLSAIQAALRERKFDAWLFYDHHHRDPIGYTILGLPEKMHVTRRWYYLIPAQGEPRGLVHAIERHNLDKLPGEKIVYGGRQQLDAGLTRLLAGVKRVAMEYSPQCAIPYVSRLDAGTAEAIKARGVEIVSSGDLVQAFEAVWTPDQLQSHRSASGALYRIKDKAFAAAAGAVRAGTPLTEYELQQQMVGWFAEAGLVSDSAPVVAVGPHAGDPHYLPTKESATVIGPDELLLLDLWGKLGQTGAVFADITWVGFTGRQVPPRMAKAFDAAARARDAAVELVQAAANEGRDLRGWEVDRAARAVLVASGFEAQVLHRTGHSLGESVHGNGAHLDDFETHDERRLLPGTGFTVEPGVYMADFGVRTEINVFRGDREALVTGPCQGAIIPLLS